MKTIEIACNDETPQKKVDDLAKIIAYFLDKWGITAVITVEDDREGERDYILK
jgi:hypothetical protein